MLQVLALFIFISFVRFFSLLMVFSLPFLFLHLVFLPAVFSIFSLFSPLSFSFSEHFPFASLRDTSLGIRLFSWIMTRLGPSRVSSCATTDQSKYRTRYSMRLYEMYTPCVEGPHPLGSSMAVVCRSGAISPLILISMWVAPMMTLLGHSTPYHVHLQ